MKAFFIGQREYMPVLQLQERLLNAKVTRQSEVRRKLTTLPLVPDVNILVEHATPVYTTGRRDTLEHLPRTSSVPVVRTKRGGGVTYHGPGQLTMYPIANLQALWKGCTAEKQRSPIEWFSEMLEKAMMDTAAEFNIPSHPFKTGVWADATPSCDARKYGSIGLQLGSNWVSMHGAGLNLFTDLAFFDQIVMCELPGRRATSLSAEMKARNVDPKSCPTSVTDFIGMSALLHAKFVSRLHQADSCHWPPVVDLSTCDDWESKVLHSLNLADANAATV